MQTASMIDVCVSAVWPALNTAGLLVLAWVARRRK
jgi:hypothetical protein